MIFLKTPFALLVPLVYNPEPAYYFEDINEREEDPVEEISSRACSETQAKALNDMLSTVNSLI